MTARIFPVDAVAGAPSYTGRYLRQTAVSPSNTIASASRPLGGLSGVRPGTPTNIVTATSTTWTVTPFGGVIDGATAAIAGSYAYTFDTNQTGSVTAAGASARVDRLDVQVVDPAEGGVSGANPLIQVVYTVGTPTLAAAPAQSHPLAQINVPISNGGSPTVTWSATYYAAPGGAVPFTTLTSLKSWTPPADGQLAYANDTDSLWEYLNSAPTPNWYHVGGRPLVGTFTPTGIYAAGSPTPQLLYMNGRVFPTGQITSTSANFVAGTTYTLGSVSTTTFAPDSGTNQAVLPCISNVTALAQVNINSSGTVSMVLNTSFTGALSLWLNGSWKVQGL